MNKTVEELVVEIERLSRGSMGIVQMSAITDEVRAHLDASIQARMELGLSLEEANEEAISSFGDPRAFVTGLVKNRKEFSNTRIDIGVCAALVFSQLCWALLVLLSRQASLEMAYSAAAICIGFVCWTSWNARRAQIIPLLGCFATGMPVFSVTYALYSFGHIGLDLRNGVMVSAATTSFLALFSLGAWMISMLVRAFRRSSRSKRIA